MTNKKLFYGIILMLFVSGISLLFVLYYPRQQVAVHSIKKVYISTPMYEKYHNDCLHPCIRYYEDGFAGYHYWMIMSPYYGWNSRVENPILYHSNSLDSIGVEHDGIEIAETPAHGFNSDPTIFLDDSILYVFWRECYTPFCDSLGYDYATVGCWTKDGVHFSAKQVYLKNVYLNGDVNQCPIVIKKDGLYFFYAAWYQYEPMRRSNGLAIWSGSSLLHPDFELVDTIRVNTSYTCDKLIEVRCLGKHWYFPWPQRRDLWHFDLFNKDGQVYMISCAEKGDNVELSVSHDGTHFEYMHTPLVNNHYMENHVGYRQYYYKPTALIVNDSLHIFWTSNDATDGNLNVLWHSVISRK